jgi:hypothetical protein
MSVYQLSRFNQLMDKSIQQLCSVPSDIAFEIGNLPWLQTRIFYPRYQAQIQAHEPSLPDLSAAELEIVEALDQQGFYVTSLDTLAIPGSDRFFKVAQNMAAELAHSRHRPDQMGKHTLTGTAAQFMAHPEIFQWGAAEKLLRIIERYLRLPVAYDGPSFYYSVADGRDAGPRKWHRDKEDWKMVKVCVYLNDVNENGGPYECVRPNINAYLSKALRFPYKPLPHRKLQSFLGTETSDWYTSCTGTAGTVIFTDTAQYYHRGKPPLDRERAAIFFGYFSQRPKNPFYCERSPLSKAQVYDLAATLSPRSQISVTWKERLPGIGRYIPKNRLKV